MSAPILLNLGDFQFSMDTAAFEELQRSSAYNWAEIPRIGLNPALQFVGVEAETITLTGKIYPHFRGGLGQIDAMRAQASAGKPLLMVDGMGSIKGFWCITRVEEGRKAMWSSGAPRLQEFTVELKFYGALGVDIAPQKFPVVSAPVGSPAPGRFARTSTPAPAHTGRFARTSTPAPAHTDTFAHDSTAAPDTPTRFPHRPRYPFGVFYIPFLGPIKLIKKSPIKGISF